MAEKEAYVRKQVFEKTAVKGKQFVSSVSR